LLGRLAVVSEGKIIAYIPDPKSLVISGRLEPAWLPVFYNPAMEFNRDLSVIILSVYIDKYAPHKPVNIVEPLAATGIRCLRYAVEVEGVNKVYCGDIDVKAYRLIEANIGLNNLWDKIIHTLSEANAYMYKLKAIGVPILVVDIDPYGSPAPFINASLNLIGNMGLLMVTATDTAVLEGSKRLKALRRYQINTYKIPQSREVAVRALIGYIARVAAGHDKWIKPLLSAYIDYYIRIYLLIGRSARKAQEMLDKDIGYAYYCKDLAYVTTDPNINDNIKCHNKIMLGPLWTGDIFDGNLLEEVTSRLELYSYIGTYKRIVRLLEVLRGEAKIQRYIHQRLDAIASTLKTKTPPRDKAIEALISRGFKATPTHFTPTGLRTDAPPNVLIDTLFLTS